MGWKQFYKISQSEFKKMYQGSQPWGTLAPWRVTIQGVEYYGAGIIASPGAYQEIYGLSPKISHPAGYNTRITVKFIFYADANEPLESASSIYIVFYVNSDTAKDESGYDAHGVDVWLINIPSTNIAELHEFKVEQSGNKITWYGDGQKLGEATLSGTLQSFALYVVTYRYLAMGRSIAEPAQQDAHGIVIYEVIGEYYDKMEDIFNMITQVMMVMMFIMVGIMMARMIYRLIKPKSKGGE